MKCPICETNNISIDEEMCNPCYVEEMYMNSERDEWSFGLMPNTSAPEVIYDEDDYGVD